MEPIANCEVCGGEAESIKHVLVDCSVAKAFWEQTKAITGIKVPSLRHETWAYDLVEGRAGTEQSQATIIIGMYALWMQRNKRKHGEALGPIRAAVQWAVDLALDLGQVSASQRPVAVPHAVQSWERPPSGWLKCNTDGAFYDQQWKGATGAVLRDEHGAFIRGSAKWYDHCLNGLPRWSDHGETVWSAEGLAGDRLSGSSAPMAGRCEVRLWQAGANQRSSIMAILKEIGELTNFFQVFKFSFAGRSCNRIAHSLAKQVTTDTRAGWWSFAPACVQELLASDCNHTLI